MARPEHRATRESRSLVEKLARTGMRQDNIAEVLAISPHTLRKHYRKEWNEGAVVANGEVIDTLFKLAKSGKNTAASIFWAKARCGWNEKPKEKDNTEEKDAGMGQLVVEVKD